MGLDAIIISIVLVSLIVAFAIGSYILNCEEFDDDELQ